MKMSVWSLARQQSVFQQYHSENITGILPTRWRQKPAGIEITSLSPYVYNTICYFNVRSKADMSQLYLPHREMICH